MNDNLTAAIEVKGLQKFFGEVIALDGSGPRGAAGHGDRAARSQWRGQDDARARARGAVADIRAAPGTRLPAGIARCYGHR